MQFLFEAIASRRFSWVAAGLLDNVTGGAPRDGAAPAVLAIQHTTVLNHSGLEATGGLDGIGGGGKGSAGMPTPGTGRQRPKVEIFSLTLGVRPSEWTGYSALLVPSGALIFSNVLEFR